jgi:sporulation and spore germination protein
MSRRLAIVAALTVVGLTGVWLVWGRAPEWHNRSAPAPAPVATAAPGPERKIKATLYYVSEDGLSLVGAEREITFGDPIVEQARRILEAQLREAPAPLASAIPAGTTLRGLFISERGDAFVDLSGDVTTQHLGGALDELFTVYVIVDALTVNLPAITRVQILIDGKEVDTLAGHVDLRHPLHKNLTWVTPPADTAARR